MNGVSKETNSLSTGSPVFGSEQGNIATELEKLVSIALYLHNKKWLGSHTMTEMGSSQQSLEC